MVAASRQTLIILTAGIDLSVAAIMVLRRPWSPARLAAELGLPGRVVALLGARGGRCSPALLNGVLVTRFRIPPFITTLGTLSVFTALDHLAVPAARPIRGRDLPDVLLWPGQTFTVLGAPITYG